MSEKKHLPSDSKYMQQIFRIGSLGYFDHKSVYEHTSPKRLSFKFIGDVQINTFLCNKHSFYLFLISILVSKYEFIKVYFQLRMIHKCLDVRYVFYLQSCQL